VLRQVGLMTLIGAVIGLAAGFAGGRGASAIMYEMNGFDPFVFIVATLLLSLVSLAAGFIPAMRASKIDPIRALRYE
jgi:ABC-type antimicrobial peptide transport system permease subunit